MRPEADTAGGDALRRLLRGYVPVPGVADELIGPDGEVRPVWRSFVSHLARLTPDEIALRFARGDRYLSDAGVFYRKYEEAGSSVRAWPLSHLPVLISENDWSRIADGLIQRADLLEKLAADLYGPNRMVAEGNLPAGMVAHNPGWLRPMVGITPVSGHFLNFIAFEIGRGPDGKWWVLGDRTEAPSGAGFALENRVASTRMFPNFYARSGVHRLAGFFRAFQSTLTGLRTLHDGEIAILTPGPMNDGHFEHTYIARYLGLLLAEGGDLTVRNGRMMIRTVEGLRPVSLLWRRQDAVSCDPLELDEHSRLGTPGLVDAVRQRQVSVLNALGSGVLETRALLAFLPQISEALIGTPLRMPNIATWWCGQPREQAHVLANRDEMMIGPAFATRLPFDSDDGTALGRSLRDGAREQLQRLLAQNGQDLVGQEAVTLSTTPVWTETGLEPRPMTLRVFLARTAEGWRVMPGGYARIGRGREATALAMQKGGSVADVWVVSDGPVAKPSLVRVARPEGDAASPGALPSRAADNLFWLGRYVERAEGQMRLFRAYFGRLAEGADPEGPLLGQLTGAFGLKPEQGPNVMAARFEGPLFAARDSAANARDRFSVDGLTALQELARAAEQMSRERIPTDEIPGRVSALLRMITGFAGLVHENMYRSTGWRFLSLGTSLERAAEMSGLLAALARPDAPDGMLDLLLELGDSTMSHRMRYSVGASHRTVADLLALDGANPRAILYHLSRARDHIAHLPGSAVEGRMSPVPRLVMRMHTRLSVESSDTLTPAMLESMRGDLFRLSDLITTTYLQ